MKKRFSRRSILAVAGGGAVGLTGCLGDSDSSESNNNDDSDADDVGGDKVDADDAAAEKGDPDDEEDPSDWEVEGSPLDASFDVTIAVENLENPWDLAFAPDGDVFLTERPGRIRRGTIKSLTGDEPSDGTELA